MANRLFYSKNQRTKLYSLYIFKTQTNNTNHISCQIQRQNVARQNATFPFTQLIAKIFR